MNELELVIQCQKNDREAFNELYKLYAAKALKTAYLITGNRNIAEDVIQEAFFKCFCDIGQLKKPELFHVWFNRLLVRICWRMSKKERKSVCSNYEEYCENTLAANATDELAETRIVYQKLREAIQGLSQPLKTTIILYYFNELSISEISKVLNCFQGTVKSRLHNARKILSEHLKADLFESERERKLFIEKEGAADVKGFSI